MIHGIIISVASAYLGYRYGARGVAKVKAEIAKFEAEFATGVVRAGTAIVARIKSVL